MSLASQLWSPIRRRLRLDHLAEWADATAEDEAAFQEYARELTVGYALLAAAAIGTCALLWWPLDFLVGPDARYVEVFSGLRVTVVLLLAIIFTAFLTSRWVQANALALAPWAYASVMAAFGYFLAQVGGPDLPWFADTFIGIVPTALIPISLRRRMLATAIIAGALSAAYFLPNPEHRQNPYAVGQLSFIVFAAVFATVTGELMNRTVRRGFLQGRSLSRARADLARMNATLSVQVAGRTQDLRRLAGHLDDVLELERARVSRELHDELGQEVTALRYTLDLVEERFDESPDALAPLLAQLGVLVDRTARTTRDVVTALRPRLVETLGFTGAVATLADRGRGSGLHVDLEMQAGSADALPEAVQVAAFRVLQEAITNAVRHAEATFLKVRIDNDTRVLSLWVGDDGHGFDPTASASGFGLLGMRERVEAAGGRVTIRSALGAGTELEVHLPLAQAAQGVTP